MSDNINTNPTNLELQSIHISPSFYQKNLLGEYDSAQADNFFANYVYLTSTVFVPAENKPEVNIDINSLSGGGSRRPNWNGLVTGSYNQYISVLQGGFDYNTDTFRENPVIDHINQTENNTVSQSLMSYSQKLNPVFSKNIKSLTEEAINVANGTSNLNTHEVSYSAGMPFLGHICTYNYNVVEIPLASGVLFVSKVHHTPTETYKWERRQFTQTQFAFEPAEASQTSYPWTVVLHENDGTQLGEYGAALESLALAVFPELEPDDSWNAFDIWPSNSSFY